MGIIKRERKPILNALPWSPGFGPHICPRCYGAGFMVDRSEASYGQLMACDGCDRASRQTIARCWAVSSMEVSDARPRVMRGLEAYTEEAGSVIAAVGAFVRDRSGWLTLTGGSGTGKSHALEAMARYFLDSGTPCVYIASVYLWEYLGGVARGEHDQADYGERFRWICGLPALMLDELNVETATPFILKTRRALLAHRYRAALNGESVTVLASNDAPERWQDGAIADRALDSRFRHVFTGTRSYRQVKRGRGEA
jgi:hypothetical protein